MYKQIAENKNRTVFLMIFVFALLVGIGWALSYIYEDSSILYWAVGISLLLNWFSYFNSDKIAIATSGAKAVDATRSLEEQQLENLVENLCMTAGIPKPKVYVIQDASLNAFATGRNPEHASIAVTTGLMEALNKAEMEGVIAHELSHVKNYDILLSTVVITLVGVITLLGDWFVRANMFRNSDDGDRGKSGVLVLVGIAFIILAPLFAQLIQLAISRRREYLADASGAMLTRYPEGLAAALEKIGHNPKTLRKANRATAHLFFVSPFADKVGETIGHLLSTHPPIHKRIEALRNM